MLHEAGQTVWPSCGHCHTRMAALHLAIRELKESQEHLIKLLSSDSNQPMVYRDATYVMDRVGISESTLLRCQKQHMISIAKIVNKKRYYLDQDVEQLRKTYWEA